MPRKPIALNRGINTSCWNCTSDILESCSSVGAMLLMYRKPEYKPQRLNRTISVKLMLPVNVQSLPDPISPCYAPHRTYSEEIHHHGFGSCRPMDGFVAHRYH